MHQISGFKLIYTAVNVPLAFPGSVQLLLVFCAMDIVSYFNYYFVFFCHLQVVLNFDTLKIYSKLIIFEFHAFFIFHPCSVNCFWKPRRGNSEL